MPITHSLGNDNAEVTGALARISSSFHLGGVSLRPGAMVSDKIVDRLSQSGRLGQTVHDAHNGGNLRHDDCCWETGLSQRRVVPGVERRHVFWLCGKTRVSRMAVTGFFV